ncbi:hypothetical protein L218DRAFT_1004562 [Marasmius fiardii PR-910]|nr:hypothetical protein L218DRAFT_1004562 [Marasmius fiardii PR-910]
MHSTPYHPYKRPLLLRASPNATGRVPSSTSSSSTSNNSERPIAHSEHPPHHVTTEQRPSPMSQTPSTVLPSSPTLLAFMPHPSRHERFPPIRRCRPLPSQNMDGTRVMIHPRLMRRSDSTPPSIQFDLSISFDELQHIVYGNQHPAPVAEYLLEEATNPPLPSITIVHPLLPWCITAHASGISPHGTTVVDVLCAIYEAVQQDLYLEGRIYKRLVFLKGRRTLVGLVESDIGGDIWEMIVE